MQTFDELFRMATGGTGVTLARLWRRPSSEHRDRMPRRLVCALPRNVLAGHPDGRGRRPDVMHGCRGRVQHPGLTDPAPGAGHGAVAFATESGPAVAARAAQYLAAIEPPSRTPCWTRAEADLLAAAVPIRPSPSAADRPRVQVARGPGPLVRLRTRGGAVPDRPGGSASPEGSARGMEPSAAGRHRGDGCAGRAQCHTGAAPHADHADHADPRLTDRRRA